MSVFSSTCGALGDEGIGELLRPVKHFLLVLGRGASAPRTFLSRCGSGQAAAKAPGLSWLCPRISQEVAARAAGEREGH